MAKCTVGWTVPGHFVRLSAFGSLGASSIPEDSKCFTCSLPGGWALHNTPWRGPGAVSKASPHADEASLTSQTKPTESICCQTPMHPKMYIRLYPEEIKVQELFHQRLSGNICHMRVVTHVGRE